jgi:hypothetical protein
MSRASKYYLASSSINSVWQTDRCVAPFHIHLNLVLEMRNNFKVPTIKRSEEAQGSLGYSATLPGVGTFRLVPRVSVLWSTVAVTVSSSSIRSITALLLSDYLLDRSRRRRRRLHGGILRIVSSLSSLLMLLMYSIRLLLGLILPYY